MHETNVVLMSSFPKTKPDALPWSEMTHGRGLVRKPWQKLEKLMSSWTIEQRAALEENASRISQDHSSTFNVFTDAGGAGQPYQLDVIPLLIAEDEWAAVAKGLKQRMELIDRVLADLYGPQELLKLGLVPPMLVHANPLFLQNCRNVQPMGGKFLLAYGCDLLRNAAGQWEVLADHTGASPGGLGQVLENRLITSNVLNSSLNEMKVARLGQFFAHEGKVYRELPPMRGGVTNVVFLTPGFQHPSYFEHAYKAKLLGFPLVEAADLTVRESRVFLKTLDGLKRIDVVICRVDENHLDPLDFPGRGDAGTPGLIEAWRAGNVVIVNAPGAGFASAPALMPFLPGICRAWLGCDLELPFVETWWLGQADIRSEVLADLSRYVLLPAFTDEPFLPIRCASLSASARRRWAMTIEERPHDFVVQLDAAPSEAPVMEARQIRHRPVIWRAFGLNAPDNPQILPGGLGRVGKSASAPQLWPLHAGFTKDVWITEAEDVADDCLQVRYQYGHVSRQSAPIEVPSRIAEQLFWVGRYTERIECTTRTFRTTLRCFSHVGGAGKSEMLDAALVFARVVSSTPKDEQIQVGQIMPLFHALTTDPKRAGSIAALIRQLTYNAASARDRLSDDTWHFINRLEMVVQSSRDSSQIADLTAVFDRLILHLSAISGMQAENMTRGHGWRFLELGRRLERASATLSMLHTTAQPQASRLPVSEILLEICDSVMTYRRRYFSRPTLDSVIDLILPDVSNPRSVGFQLQIIKREMASFPGNGQSEKSRVLPQICEMIEMLDRQIAEAKRPGSDEFEQWMIEVEAVSSQVNEHFFSHSTRKAGGQAQMIKP